MSYYTVIGKPGENARLIISGSSTEEFVSLQLSDGEVGLPSDYLSEYSISKDGKTLQPAIKSLQILKLDKIAELLPISRSKLNLWETPEGGLQTDDSSLIRLSMWENKAIIAKNNNTSFDLPYWIMADNSHKYFEGPDEFLGFYKAATDYKTAVVLYNSSLKNRIENSTSVEELNSIDLQEGWPI